MGREDRNILGFTVALISEFAAHYGIRPRQAYAYLKRYKGMEHLSMHLPKSVRTMEEDCDDTTLSRLELEG